MSAPRLISPLLDNFIMGEPIFEQSGVRILPAMEQGKEEKYIVKIISIPANQSQVDALLITGAYKDAESVNGYFAELADAVVHEAGVLSRLSNAGGFDGYVDTQVVPMDDGNGYDVYLLAPYRPTWDRISQQKAITQLDGYNLALDICAALSVARRNGYMYANLKPESVSISASGSYHISDLGLIGLDYLQYSSLPTANFSAYTAPEVADAYSALNSTMDVYALGMMLYEVFNGCLPFDGPQASATEYPAPAYADEEFAQVILKAIHPDPAARWQDPTEMGQAIISVMQRNGVSDAPIVPVVEIQDEPASADEAAAPAEKPLEDEIVSTEEATVPIEELSQELPVTVEEIATPEEATETSEDVPQESDVPEIVVPVIEACKPEVADVVEQEELNTPVTEESLNSENTKEAIQTEEVVQSSDVPGDDSTSEDDLDNILEEADKLIADLQIDPDSMLSDEVYEQLVIEETSEEPYAAQTTEEPVLAGPIDAEEDDQPAVSKRSGKRMVAIICSVILAALLIVGCLFFYRHVYLQEIDILSVIGEADTVSVAVVTDVESSKLTVVCTDESGNVFESKLVDYKAEITGLAAETNYTVSLRIDGFHKLIGQTEYAYTTPEKTIISDFTVLNGTTEGTAEVSFQVVGPNEGNWSVIFTTQDEQPHSAAAIDGKATVTGLTLGKTYTVTLSSSATLYLDENMHLTLTAGAVIKPINPYVLSNIDGKLTVQWTAPAGSENQTWIVRCFNESGFDETVTVNELTATFNIPDSKNAYSIEISAKGQAAKEVLAVTENSITLSDFTVDTSLPGRITLNWTASADVPEGGYVVTYTIDGVKTEKPVNTGSNSLTILSAVPNAEHTFTFAGVNGESILCAPVTVKATGKNPFSAFGIKAGNMRFNLCPRPSKSNWVYSDVKSSAYTTTFSVGQKASVVGRILSKYYTSKEVVSTVYVFKNADNVIIHTCYTEEQWGDMWNNGYGTFDIPSLPELPGSYKLDMYIDGGLVHQADITIK